MTTLRTSRQQTFRRVSAFAAAVVLSTIVGACSSDDSSDTSVDESVATTDVESSVPTSDAAVAVTEAPMAAIDQVVAPRAGPHQATRIFHSNSCCQMIRVCRVGSIPQDLFFPKPNRAG